MNNTLANQKLNICFGVAIKENGYPGVRFHKSLCFKGHLQKTAAPILCSCSVLKSTSPANNQFPLGPHHSWILCSWVSNRLYMYDMLVFRRSQFTNKSHDNYWQPWETSLPWLLALCNTAFLKIWCLKELPKQLQKMLCVPKCLLLQDLLPLGLSGRDDFIGLSSLVINSFFISFHLPADLKL